ncbi:hypothetical protein COL940_010300 [Colletotrichum noveboracense]|nr:hypothetical protein COL940_010300 [Colletotrichum noveboracense]
MTIAFPVSGSFVNYAGRWVDPALAFGAGFAEWLVSIFLCICLVVFFLPNKFFAWLQSIGSLVKIILFVFVIFLSLALIAGAGPTGSVKDGSYWREGKAFQNGFMVMIRHSRLTMLIGD